MRKLHVITARSNPFLYETPQRIFEEWALYMASNPHVELTVVELQYGDRPFKCLVDHPSVKHIGVRSHSVLWAKENLINIGFQYNKDAKYFAWIDSDIFFRDHGWAYKTIEALQFHDFIQPWKHCYDLGPENEHMQMHESFCSLFYEDKPINNSAGSKYTFAHPGYAWAATRQALEYTSGLLDRAILGSADHHIALSLIGKAQDSYPGDIDQSYKDMVNQWQEAALRHIHKNIGYLKGTIEHKFHGSKANRFYQTRWEILTRNHFNPYRDIKKNLDGVYVFTGSKPRLEKETMQYFAARNEDSNQK